MIDKDLLEILACPACKGDIEYDQENQRFICYKCKKVYPIKGGIPIMLIDEAEDLSKAEGGGRKAEKL